jgi:hypothetical protein
MVQRACACTGTPFSACLKKGKLILLFLWSDTCLAVSHAVPAGRWEVTAAFRFVSELTVLNSERTWLLYRLNVVKRDETNPDLIHENLQTDTTQIQHYNSRHQITCFKATEGLHHHHPPPPVPRGYNNTASLVLLRCEF